MNAPKSRDARAPIAAHQALEPNRPTLGGRMHKAVLPNVDANMGVFLAGGVEKHKVARKSILGGHLSASRPHLLNSAWQRLARGPTHHVDHQAAAVETACGGVATPSVWNPHQRECMERRLGKALLCLFKARWWKARTAGARNRGWARTTRPQQARTARNKKGRRRSQ